MDSLGKAITILNEKKNTKVEFLSQKVTPKCDVTTQRIAVKFMLAPINHPFRRQFYSLNIRINLEILTSSTKFVFFGTIRKTR